MFQQLQEQQSTKSEMIDCHQSTPEKKKKDKVVISRYCQAKNKQDTSGELVVESSDCIVDNYIKIMKWKKQNKTSMVITDKINVAELDLMVVVDVVVVDVVDVVDVDVVVVIGVAVDGITVVGEGFVRQSAFFESRSPQLQMPHESEVYKNTQTLNQSIPAYCIFTKQLESLNPDG
jgi:hypothetical protein